MSQYYTSIDLVNNKFVGRVYNQLTNALEYESEGFDAQSSAINDITNFVNKNKTPTLPPTHQPGRVISNTIHLQPTGPVKSGRCCGR